MHPLHHKVVLVTGGSSGIGRATALRLAGHGARVAVAARSAGALAEVVEGLKQRGGEGLAVPTDVADREQCRRAVERTVERFGGLDVLVCSAGVSMRGAFADSDPDAVERVFRVNFFGTLYTTLYALPHLRRTRGSLVAVSSMVGKRNTPSYSVYGASKFAVQGLYESLRAELAPDGVHVGVVSPGHVATPLRQRVLRPDGEVWEDPPTSPFRVWPVEKCVDRVVRLIVKRKREALLPAYVRPMLAVEDVIGPWLGDRVIGWFFGRRARREGEPPGEPPEQARREPRPPEV
jgi:NAD(P)-dependent dehydrogenase (short-subunit alcohol dehydrogenase family)